MQKEVKTLGYLGLIPFVTIPIALQMGMLSYAQAFAFFSQYSAIILSFFGGVHWFAALTEPTNRHQIYVAMLPSIVGWLALVVFADARTLGVLSLAYVGMVVYDKFTLRLSKHMIVEYTRMRVILTTIVVICHAAMIWLSSR
ncbi:DUF3429 domain-containing protein [Alteromonas oceanisediminis]|uniref:DUF3429 domain-containing protein n=1 Tax=Alteromonas oceanisediminis TaxID=2836180 RepID=UPI001BD987A3|nr:DUF3429 domain-containing protein [Alteromonas oceanisediminis]MBT0586485.1 DUF3429 family protein [Alteromonas oceanisediminis]